MVLLQAMRKKKEIATGKPETLISDGTQLMFSKTRWPVWNACSFGLAGSTTQESEILIVDLCFVVGDARISRENVWEVWRDSYYQRDGRNCFVRGVATGTRGFWCDMF
jgi:hypothetical protein